MRLIKLSGILGSKNSKNESKKWFNEWLIQQENLWQCQRVYFREMTETDYMCYENKEEENLTSIGDSDNTTK